MDHHLQVRENNIRTHIYLIQATEMTVFVLWQSGFFTKGLFSSGTASSEANGSHRQAWSSDRKDLLVICYSKVQNQTCRETSLNRCNSEKRIKKKKKVLHQSSHSWLVFFPPSQETPSLMALDDIGKWLPALQASPCGPGQVTVPLWPSGSSRAQWQHLPTCFLGQLLPLKKNILFHSHKSHTGL